MPPIEAKDLDGNPVDITASVAGHWAAILLYRGRLVTVLPSTVG